MILAGLLIAHAFMLGVVVAPRARAHRNALRKLPREDGQLKSWPSVCVFVPARNEQDAIGRCVESLLAQEYPGRFHVVVANDHSEDSTGDILRALAAHTSPELLTVFDVPKLPPGWMGKNHGLWNAVRRAPWKADLYLFTDADVLYHATMIRRAVVMRERLRADMLFAFPSLDVIGFWERAILPAAGQFMMFSLDPKKIETPGRREVMGVGAFNLLRREHYESFGGHEAIRGEVLDDVALGMKTKEAGGALRAVGAGGALRIRMYTSLPAIVDGFSKNFHAAVGGGLAPSFMVALWNVFLGTAPSIVFVANAATGNALGAVLALAWHLTWGLLILRGARGMVGGAPLWPAVFFHPLAYLTLAWIAVRSSWIGAVRGEIHWRGRKLPRPRQSVKIGIH